jgi:hypothetical protein
MKKITVIFYGITLILLTNVIYPQKKDSVEVFSSNTSNKSDSINVLPFHIENIRIRKSFDCSDDFTKPAVLIIAIPKEDKNTFLVDAALGLDFDISNNIKNSYIFSFIISPIVEYHLNNTTKNKQNILQLGAFIDWQLFSVINIGYTPISNTKINYNIDLEKETSSISLSEYFTFQFDNHNTFKYFLPQRRYFKNNIISYDYSPSLGLEYNNKISVKTEEKKGPYLNLYSRILLNLYPLGNFFSNRIEVQSDFIYRYYTIDVNQNNGRYKKLFVQSFNFYIYKTVKSAVELGIDYTYGDDPSKSLYYQDIWNFVLKIKL